MATYTLIDSNTLTSSALSVTFSAIPATYTDLVVKVSARTSEAVDNELLVYRFNGTAGTSYSSITLIGNSSTVVSNKPTNAGNIRLGWETGASATLNTFSSGEIYIPSYLANQNKPTSNFSAAENNSADTAASYINANAGLARITDAITSITIFSINDLLFVADSSFYLYGISNA